MKHEQRCETWLPASQAEQGSGRIDDDITNFKSCVPAGQASKGRKFGRVLLVFEFLGQNIPHKKSRFSQNCYLSHTPGSARSIADYLHDPSADWPKKLSLSASADSDCDALLTDDERQKLADRIAEVEVLIKKFRSALLSAGSVNGLSSQLVRDSMLDEKQEA